MSLNVRRAGDNRPLEIDLGGGGAVSAAPFPFKGSFPFATTVEDEDEECADPPVDIF